MSKKTSTSSTKKKQLAYKTTNKMPVLRQVKVDWDLVKHYYRSENDPLIEQNAKQYERKVKSFIKKYKNSDFTNSPEKLLTALKDSEKLSETVEASRIMRYFSFRTTINVNDNEATRKLHQFAERFRKLANEAIFFDLLIGKISKNKQKEYLNNKKLSKYHYILKQNFETAKHQLSEAEERILSLRSNTSSGMWADAVEKIVSNRTITFRKKTYALPEALEQIDSLSWKDKSILWNLILDQLEQISEVAEHELTAIVTHEKVSDELRKYNKPYSATVQAYENNEKSVEALVEAISTKGFALSRKFYKLKAALHGRETIPYVNKYDSIGSLPRPDFSTSVDICRDTFYNLDKRYGELFDTMLENGQLDVYPKKGKRGGAFMSSTIGLPTFVMLNHTNDFKSLQTLAHEVGHAIHAELSKSQPAIYEDFSITTAETASTLFEQFVSELIYSKLEEKDKPAYLHDKISRDIATVQRQISFFNFELEMHNHIREHGVATRQELSKMMQKHLKSYLGSSVEVTERDGYSYVYISHIRYGFYVYSYTYGHLVSNLMIQNFKENNNFLDKINLFLHAGGSDTVENIFKAIGIDTNNVKTFTDSLKTHTQEISLLEKLTKK